MLTLRRNNTDERALSGWGITAATLTYRSQAADDLTLTCAGDALADPVFADGDILDLYDSGVRLFSGRLQTNPHSGSAAREGHTYTAEGGFWWLDACTYEQSGYHYNEDNKVVAIASSHIVLNCGSSYSNHISVATQIANAVGYAISAYGAPLQLAALSGFGRIAPIEEAMDLSCGEVVRRELRWAPDSVTWVDYATTPPTLHCARHADLIAADYDITGGDEVTDWLANPRYDRQVSRVAFVYEGIAYKDEQLVSRCTLDAAGPGTDKFRQIVHTFTLAYNSSTGRIELPPTGLAAAYYESLKDLTYEAKLVARRRTPNYALRPGRALNFSGTGRAAHAGMRALIQQAAYYLVTGGIEVTAGPPEHLSPSDLRSLAAATKSTRTETTKGDQNPTDDNPAPAPGPAGPTPTPTGPTGNPMELIALEVCQGGSPTTVYVYGGGSGGS